MGHSEEDLNALTLCLVACICSAGIIICFLALRLEKYKRRIHDLSLEVEKFRRLAFIDTLTTLPNRTAFDRETSMIEKSKGEYKILACMIFDLNYLKITNDTFGHKAGDELIKGTGYCIQKTFQDLGLSFRLGGDEFAVILKDIPEEAIAEGIQELCENIVEYNDTHTYKIDISWGVAIDEKEPDIRRLLGQADARMYQNKRESKALG